MFFITIKLLRAEQFININMRGKSSSYQNKKNKEKRLIIIIPLKPE